MTDIALVHAFIDRAFPEHLRRIQEFLRQPSISSENIGLVETALWLQDYIATLGGQARLEGDPQAPIVFAQFDASRLAVDRAKTLLVYGMYDVQPVAGQKWTSDPFGAEIRDLSPCLGPCVIARGACNSKGPLMGFLNAVQALRETVGIPLNLVLTVEGEEEIGSPNLPRFYEQHKPWLQADAGFEPFWAEYGTDVIDPVLALGSKGIVSVELVCRAGSWGGPVLHEVHSSAGGWIASPAWRLIKALNTLIDENEAVTIQGLHDDVTGPSREDERLLAALGETFDAQGTLAALGAQRFKYELPPTDLLRKYLFEPSLHIGRVTHAEGDALVTEAHAELLIRTVADMRPQGTVDRLRAHLSALGFGDIEVRLLAAYPGSRTRLTDSVVQCMLATYHDHGVAPRIWPLLASATPYYLFSEVLGIPYVWGGLGKAGGSHAPNEYASVEGLKLFEKSIATFLYRFAHG